MVDMDAVELAVDALAQLGLAARPPGGGASGEVDLVLDPEGVATPLQVKRRSLVTDQVAERLLSDPTTAQVLVIVADRITDAARGVLTARGAGYIDLRGRVAIRTDRIVIDAEIEPLLDRPARSHALSGKSGLEVAAALLMEPEREFPVRELARQLGRSPSTVSEVLAALRRDGLVDERNVATGTDLFWQLADRWSTRRTPVATAPNPDDSTFASPLRLGLDDASASGWALTDSAAALVYGAPIALRSGQALDFFVPDQATVRRATTLLGPAPSAALARATVRVAPVPAVVHCRVDLHRHDSTWPLAHPLFVALDLAQDVGRGREVLEAWTPGARWARIW